jgi:hypothetical protein
LVGNNFADRHFADRHFADRHFADMHFSGIWPTGIFPTQFGQQSIGQFLNCLDQMSVSQMFLIERHLVKMTVHSQASLFLRSVEQMSVSQRVRNQIHGTNIRN